MPNILINPRSGILEFNTGIAGSSAFDTNLSGLRMTYDNFGAINLLSYNTNPSSGVDRFTIDGTNGRLFSVTDNLFGSLFSVNDIAGLPIIEAFDDNTVVMGAFNRNDFVLSGNSLGLGAVPNTGTTKLYVGGNLLVSGNIFISGNQVFTGIGPFATTSNLFATGSILDNKINSLSGYVNSQDLIFSGQAFNTGSRLDNKINSLSGYVNSQDIIFSGQIASTGSSLYNSILSLSGLFTGYTGNLDANFASDSQLFATGSILDNKINSLSGYVNSQDILFSGQTFNTGSRLDSKINSLSGWSASSGNLFSTGSNLDNKINSLSGYVNSQDVIFSGQIFNTGSTLDNKINSLSGYINSQDIIFSGQIALTGSNLNNKINNLSGYINSSSSNIVFTTGNQIISGVKTFASRPTVNNTGILLSGEAAPKDIATTLSISSNTISLDLSTFSYFLVNLNSNITTANFNNPKAPPEVTNFVLQLSGDGTIRSVTWPTSLRWPGSAAPTITIGPNKVDTYSIFSYDGGVNYYGFPAGYNS